MSAASGGEYLVRRQPGGRRQQEVERLPVPAGPVSEALVLVVQMLMEPEQKAG